jgi:hypothetical protein
MANISDAQRKQRLLNALPPDGTSRGNRALARELKWKPDLYLKIRDDLVTEGKVQVGRGRGGSVRLTKPTPVVGKKKQKTAIQQAAKPTRGAERKLYPDFLKSLHTWAEAQGWTDKLVQQTSDQGSKATGGKYTRPDFVVVGIKKYEYTPGLVRDVETFEVKPLGALIDGVFEAAAHSRAATRSYLALQVAPDSPTEDQLARFEAECQRFGVGLITFTDPGDYENWTFLVDPVRTEPDPELLEQFVRDQMNKKNQETVRKWVR